LSLDDEETGLVDSPIRGIILITIAMLVFSVQDVIIRLLSGGYSGFEIVFIRGLVAIIPICFFVYMSGGLKTLRMRHPVLNIVRSSLMFFSYLTFYSALAAMPIAEVTAIFFISPLITTVFSVVFLKEYVGIRRWVAVLAGFAGVLVIVQPGSDSMNPAAFLPIMAATTYSLSVMTTRRLGPTQNGASLAFYSMMIFIIFSAIIGISFGDGRFASDAHPSIAFLLREWIIPAQEDLMLLILCGVVAACGFYCISQSYRIAPVSTVAPFEYTAMPCAVLWGIVIWNEIPPATTLIGIAMIISSGLYVLHRASILKKRTA
jgi:S-adenosylmethionine uptake transporter